jgi:hypothetical protein
MRQTPNLPRYSPQQIAQLLPFLTAGEIANLDDLLRSAPAWLPLPGPQEQAYSTAADITGFGGAAGGGKARWLSGWR